MARITCPNCGEVIEVDPNSVEDLTRQLRDETFEHDLAARLEELGHTNEATLAAARAEERQVAEQRIAAVQTQMAELQARLDAAAELQQRTREQALQEAERQKAANEERLASAIREAELARAAARAAAEQERAELQAQLDAAARAQELAVARERTEAAEQRARLQHELDAARAQTQEEAARARQEAGQERMKLTAEIARLSAELDTQKATLRAQADAELVRTTSQLEQDKATLASRLELAQAQSEQALASLRADMARREAEAAQRAEEQLAVKDAQIEDCQAEIERLRDYRMRLPTKLVGESLERHCEAEFNRIRMQAYPDASFEKDNTAVEGTKGDYIFRDFDQEGTELLSIMFEMKNEEEGSSASNRKRNEDHFKKLDADRRKKNCEYAVLVSTLEPDNEFYNAGIADVSWQYEKMFVVRPQCFLSIIGLLKAAALAAQPYRRQIESMRREQLDVSRFEEKVDKLVSGIGRDYELAAKNYEQAERDIDQIIAKLEHLKGQLGSAAKHFGTAAGRGEKLSVKRLTWGNQTMKAAFAEAAQRGPDVAEAEEVRAEPLDEEAMSSAEEPEVE